ncbi:hypothetical protein [Fusobacterium sp.]|uniref:hypothetical protein n=1 Tax=Fusobacterium sp. TaxID=68766 RepID=UPI002E7A8F01|nr:hypothetical protein [Fusobacterium sp.]MEE1475748.1 hypothetical protein [Fusobacterium sp.]
MKDLTILNKDTITSLELVEQINFFRKQEGRKTETQHYDLLKIIRNEFDEEINEGKILPVTYTDKKGEERPMYILTLNQAKQVLMRESKFVRKAVIKYIEHLEKQLQGSINYQEQDYIKELIERVNSLEKLVTNTVSETKTMTLKQYVASRGISSTFSINTMATKASLTCKKKGIKVNKILEAQYKLVNAYPLEILNKVYSKMLESNSKKENISCNRFSII